PGRARHAVRPAPPRVRGGAPAAVALGLRRRLAPVLAQGRGQPLAAERRAGRPGARAPGTPLRDRLLRAAAPLTSRRAHDLYRPQAVPRPRRPDPAKRDRQLDPAHAALPGARSEERRVGKEGRTEDGT